MRTRILVGDSVFEDATLTVKDGWLFVEFDADDLDDIAVECAALPDDPNARAWLGINPQFTDEP